MSDIEINGYRLEYFEHGTGEPVVFVHGSASDYRTWKFQQDKFAEHFRSIVYSRRYHWPNKPIPEGIDYSMNEHINDLEALIESLEVAPAHLIGHSYGAFICLVLAIRKPQVVRTLVLAEPPATTLFVSKNPKPVEILKLLINRPHVAVALMKFRKNGITPAVKAFRKGETEKAIRIFGDAVFGPRGYLRFTLSRKKQVIENLTNVRSELIGSGFVPLDVEIVQDIHVPTLLVSGEHSIGLFHHITNSLERVLPNGKKIEIPEANHMMHEDNPDVYNRVVIQFLSNNLQTI